MLYTIILNTKSETLEQQQYISIYDACRTVDNYNKSEPSDNRQHIVKTANEPIVNFGNPTEWLEFLEDCKFILAMKDHWDSDDFYNNQQLFNSIQAVKKYMYG